ncbi:hypothetical protein BH10PSE6_BH10PSE6_16680 [soil metagenome]
MVPSAIAPTANPADAKWDDLPLSAAFVAEARRRGETPQSCLTILQVKLREGAPASAPQFDELSLAELCRVALAASVTATSNPAQSTWDDRPFVATYIQEAQRRGQTAQSCAIVLPAPPTAPR